MTGRNNALKKYSNGNPLLVTKVRKKGVPDLKWLDKMKLTTTSNPIEYVNAMIMTNDVG